MKVAVHVEGRTVRGNERQLIRVATGLGDRGHDVVVSCPAGGVVMAELGRLGVATTGIRPRGDSDLVAALRFARWLRVERFDAVLLTSWKRLFTAGWAARVARVPRVVFRLGGVHPVALGARGWRKRHPLSRWHDAVIVNSGAVADHVTGPALAVPPQRVHLIVNGIEAPAPGTPPSRDALGLPDGARLLAAVGGVERRKGFDLLVEALATLDDDVHAVLVGAGAPERERWLEDRARALGVRGRLHLLGRREDVPAVLAACEAFVLPSRAEGMSIAVLEAMAAGLPVVAFDVGGVRETLAAREGRPDAGWIVPREDVPALAAALRECLDGVRSGAAEVERRVAEASWRLEHWFSTDRMVERYEAVLAGTAPAAGDAP